MKSVIEINGLCKYFGKLRAVDNVTMQIHKGEIFGFLGPNGAGKSTTIRCAMGFLRPTSGTVTVLGYDMANQADKAKSRIGYLPGNVRLYDAWTGWDHIRFFESVRGTSPLRDELMTRLNFNPSIPFRHLSSGNKQKLGLILALMHAPDILIMDEPTVGLDPLLQNEIYEILKEMKRNDVTIFISSHNLPEVEKLCDRVALIKDGKLATVATMANLAKRKTHNLEVKFDGKFDLSELKKIPDVTSLQSAAGAVTATINGDLNAVVQLLAKHTITDLKIEHASLEDVFIEYYKKDETKK